MRMVKTINNSISINKSKGLTLDKLKTGIYDRSKDFFYKPLIIKKTHLNLIPLPPPLLNRILTITKKLSRSKRSGELTSTLLNNNKTKNTLFYFNRVYSNLGFPLSFFSFNTAVKRSL